MKRNWSGSLVLLIVALMVAVTFTSCTAEAMSLDNDVGIEYVMPGEQVSNVEFTYIMTPVWEINMITATTSNAIVTLDNSDAFPINNIRFDKSVEVAGLLLFSIQEVNNNFILKNPISAYTGYSFDCINKLLLSELA